MVADGGTVGDKVLGFSLLMPMMTVMQSKKCIVLQKGKS